ncbi:putative amino acid transporter [Oscillibacter valericigenes Sjm18-20]|nr:putative amino acid transporter [Oscillibacter valericigenes Sjm18-20]
MENGLKKKYGLPTAICMVVGIVIGSGVFFKAEAVLVQTGGNMPLGILAWLIVGAIMIVCSYVFATMATRYEKVNGLVDYAEATVGNRYAYLVGWFMATIYTPALTSVLAWVSARYFSVLMGWDITGGSCLVLACFFLCVDYALNALSPRIAGRFQISTTVIKMVPLLLMAVVGTAVGLSNGQMAQNFATISTGTVSAGEGLMKSTVAVAFAYEGWILATSINAELKDAKRNLPRALVLGSFIVVATYILYYIGLNGAVTTEELMASGEAAAKMAYQRVFGGAAGTVVFVLIVISCLGTLNGLMLSNCRSFYAIAARGEGPRPEMFDKVDPVTNIPSNSATLSLAFAAFWLLYFYGANLTDGWFGPFCFDSSELPIITLYGMYVAMFIQFMRKERELNGFKRFVMPVLGLCGCLFMVYAAFAGYGVKVYYYLAIYVAFMLVGNCFYRKKI